MKILELILIFVFSAICSIGQTPDQPFSFKDTILSLKELKELDFLVTETPDYESIEIIIDSLENENINHPEFYGYAFSYNLESSNIGTWDTLENGDRIWRYHIICPNSKTVNFVFENLNIAKNSHISFYNEEKNSLLGPYTEHINKENRVFTTHLINGSSVVIELYEPLEDNGNNKFTLSKIVYGFSEMNSFTDKKVSNLQSGICQIDANCSQGNDFCKEKFSVARLIMDWGTESLWAFCTGSLINNVEEDYIPYFLTGFHCLDNGDGIISQTEKNSLNDWSMQFGYIREFCSSGNSLTTFEYHGGNFKSGWEPTDFLLIELQTQPISGENNFPDVYFNGWDRSGNIPTNVVTLHHPSGDFMKISIDYNSPIITGYTNYYFCQSEDNNEYYWKTIWDQGTTEGGSSGGPLFDGNSKKVIGQLRGGCSLCDEADWPDYFGRLFKSWEGGGTSDTRLKDWLDPINSGVTTLDGIKMPNLQYGWIFPNSSVTHYAAYTDMQIGSNSTSSYKVESGAVLSLKAGREIKISPCTQIRAGSEFHAYIENPDCDDIAPLSDKLTDHNPNICSTYPKIVKEDKDFNSAYTGNTMLKVSPNPVTSISDISLTIGSSDNVSLMLYDNLGNQ